ncbi:hypothetical protein GE21DRAFT_1110283 [Neurospora crassa]|nr:hypothetical protein GE21DRAFT_1110283 [Neurospora crassa]
MCIISATHLQVGITESHGKCTGGSLLEIPMLNDGLQLRCNASVPWIARSSGLASTVCSSLQFSMSPSVAVKQDRESQSPVCRANPDLWAFNSPLLTCTQTLLPLLTNTTTTTKRSVTRRLQAIFWPPFFGYRLSICLAVRSIMSSLLPWPLSSC